VSDPRDYKVELSGAAGGGGAGAVPAQPRPYLGVHFACCGVYQRVYRDADGKAYRGRCPRCGVAVTFAVADGGTSARSFVVR
jgi:hypothetical protein